MLNFGMKVIKLYFIWTVKDYDAEHIVLIESER